jgi:hypothetical protein
MFNYADGGAYAEYTLRRNVDEMREALKTLPRIRKGDKTSKLSSEIGFKQIFADKIRYVVRIQKFKDFFVSEHQRKLVTEFLIEERKLTLAETKGVSNMSYPKEQIIWPGRERCRSYEIFWPREKSSTRKFSKKGAIQR